jgi:hypothetical protein
MTSSLVAEMRAVMARVKRAWDAAGLHAPVWALALHPMVVERCDRCGSWGELVPGDRCQHGLQHRRFIDALAMTTLGGETVPLSAALLKQLLVANLWLSGRVPGSIRRLPVQDPHAPVTAAELMLLVAPSLRATDLESTPIYARLTADLVRRPLILLTQQRPACLPP